VSGSEIAEDISRKAGKVFLSVRPNEGDIVFKFICAIFSADPSLWIIVGSVFHETRNMYLSRVPRDVSIVGEIKFFHPLPIDSTGIQSGVVELINGTVSHTLLMLSHQLKIFL
jgi:hypothetical protein